MSINETGNQVGTSRILSLLDNLSQINNLYQQIVEVEEEHLETAKITEVTLNDTKFSFYYLMKRTFYYSNKYNNKLKIVFRLKSNVSSLFFVAIISVLSGEIPCNNFKCNESHCKDGKHYYQTRNDCSQTLKHEDANELVLLIEKKIHSYNTCENCSKIWDMNLEDRQEEIDEDHSHICDNCAFTNHLNEKTLESLGDCSICLKSMYCNDLVKTECEHLFHKECLKIWLNKKNNCPLCRFTLV